MILKNPGRWGQHLEGCAKPKPRLCKGVKLALMVMVSAHAAMNASFPFVAADLPENKIDTVPQGPGVGHEGGEDILLGLHLKEGDPVQDEGGQGDQNTSGSVRSDFETFDAVDGALKEVFDGEEGSEDDTGTVSTDISNNNDEKNTKKYMYDGQGVEGAPDTDNKGLLEDEMNLLGGQDAYTKLNLRGSVGLESSIMASDAEGLLACRDPENPTSTKCDEEETCGEYVKGKFRTRNHLLPSYSERPWHAFIPTSCTESTKCPLFFWLDGTGECDMQPTRQQKRMIEMVKRGFVAVTADYTSFPINYGGCWGSPINTNVGVVDKAQDIFDRTRDGSVIQQICNGASTNKASPVVDCGLGVAVGGFSQGGQIVALAGDYDDRVSAEILFSSGNEARLAVGHMYCMDTLKLAKARRRLIFGDNDNQFGKRWDYIREQVVEISHFECKKRKSDNDDENCFVPSNREKLSPTDTDSEVDDPYTGRKINNTGGYFMINNGGHGQYMGGNKNGIYQDSAKFLNKNSTEVPWGEKASFDWLAATARITKKPIQLCPSKVTLEMDLDHWALLREKAPQGIFFEWAAAVPVEDGKKQAVLGRRWVVSHGVTSYRQDFTVPKDVIGFRLTARTHNAAFVDQLHIKTKCNVFKKLSFDRNRHSGYCFATVQERDWERCIGGKSHACIDFCTDGSWHDCTGKEFSQCPISPPAPCPAPIQCRWTGCTRGGCKDKFKELPHEHASKKCSLWWPVNNEYCCSCPKGHTDCLPKGDHDADLDGFSTMSTDW